MPGAVPRPVAWDRAGRTTVAHDAREATSDASAPKAVPWEIGAPLGSRTTQGSALGAWHVRRGPPTGRARRKGRGAAPRATTVAALAALPRGEHRALSALAARVNPDMEDGTLTRLQNLMATLAAAGLVVVHETADGQVEVALPE